MDSTGPPYVALPRPIIPISTDRVKPPHMFPFSGPSQPFLEGSPLPGWSACVHPEGSLYFYRNSSPRVVTEACLYQPELAAAMSRAIERLDTIISQRNIQLSDRAELCLRLDESLNVSYYFVDHSSRSLFWLDPLDPSTQQLHIASPSHLRLVLEECYWNHVERFPTHFGGLDTQAVDELISVVVHGYADRLTLPASTFPFSAEQCAAFLPLLRESRGNMAAGFTTAFVARLWSLVVHTRIDSHYSSPRLGRENHLLLNSALGPLFGGPEFFVSRLEEVYIDKLAYQDRWHQFISVCHDHWKLSASWAVPLLMTNTVMSFSSKTLPILTIATSLVSSMSILAAMLLLILHQEHANNTSLVARSMQKKRPDTAWLWHVAVMFSLPRALCFWSVVLFVSHWNVIAAQTLNVGTAVGSVMMLLVLVVGVWYGVPGKANMLEWARRTLWDRLLASLPAS